MPLLLLIIALAGLSLAPAAAAEEPECDERVILPVPGPKPCQPSNPEDHPVWIPVEPNPEATVPAEPNPEVTVPTEPNPEATVPEVTYLHLWIQRNGQRQMMSVPCGPRCPQAQLLFRLSLRADRCPVARSNLRAGGRYLGQRIGTFSRSNRCQSRIWQKAAPLYREYF